MINSGLNKLLENKRRFDFVKESKAKNTVSTLLKSSQNNGNGTQGEDNPQVDVPIPETTPGVVFSPLEKLTRPEFLQPKPIKLIDTIVEPTSTKVAQQEIYQPPDERLVKAVEEEGAKSYDIFGRPTGMTKAQQSGLAQLEELAKERRKPLFQKAVESVYSSLENSRKIIQRGIEQGNVIDVGLGTISVGLNTIMTPMNFFTPAGQKIGVEFGELIGNERLGEKVGEFLPFLTMPNPIAFYAASKGSEVATNEVMKVINNADMSDVNKERILSAVGLGSFILTHRLISGGIKKIKEPDVKEWLNSEIEKISSEELNKSTLGKEDIDQTVLNELNPKQEQGLTTEQKSRIELKPEEDLTGEKINVGDVGIEELTDLPTAGGVELASGFAKDEKGNYVKLKSPKENKPTEIPKEEKPKEILDALERIKKSKEDKNASTIKSTEQVSERKVRTRVGEETPLRPTDEGITPKEEISTPETGGQIEPTEAQKVSDLFKAMEKPLYSFSEEEIKSFVDPNYPIQAKFGTELLDAIDFYKKHYQDIPSNSNINEIISTAKDKGYDLTLDGASYGLGWYIQNIKSKGEAKTEKKYQGEIITSDDIKVSKFNAKTDKGRQFSKDITIPANTKLKIIEEGISTGLALHGEKYFTLEDERGNTYNILNKELTKKPASQPKAGEGEVIDAHNQYVKFGESNPEYLFPDIDKGTYITYAEFKKKFKGLNEPSLENHWEKFTGKKPKDAPKDLIVERDKLQKEDESTPKPTLLDYYEGKAPTPPPNKAVEKPEVKTGGEVKTESTEITSYSYLEGEKPDFSNLQSAKNNKTGKIAAIRFTNPEGKIEIAVGSNHGIGGEEIVKKYGQEFYDKILESGKFESGFVDLKDNKFEVTKESKPIISGIKQLEPVRTDLEKLYGKKLEELTKDEISSLVNALNSDVTTDFKNIFPISDNQAKIIRDKFSQAKNIDNNKSEAMRLFKLKKSDREVGLALNVKPSEVRKWREEFEKEEAKPSEPSIGGIIDKVETAITDKIKEKDYNEIQLTKINKVAKERFDKAKDFLLTEIKKFQEKAIDEIGKEVNGQMLNPNAPDFKGKTKEMLKTLIKKGKIEDFLEKGEKLTDTEIANQTGFWGDILGKTIKLNRTVKLEIPDDGTVTLREPTLGYLLRLEKDIKSTLKWETPQTNLKLPTGSMTKTDIRDKAESFENLKQAKEYLKENEANLKEAQEKGNKNLQEVFQNEYDKASKVFEIAKRLDYEELRKQREERAEFDKDLKEAEKLGSKLGQKVERGRWGGTENRNLTDTDKVERYRLLQEFNELDNPKPNFNVIELAKEIKEGKDVVAYSFSSEPVEFKGDIDKAKKYFEDRIAEIKSNEKYFTKKGQSRSVSGRSARQSQSILENNIKDYEHKIGTINVDRIELDRLLKSTPLEKPKEEIKTENRVVKEKTYQRTKKNLKGKLGNLSANIDPTTLKDLATVGAYHFENGLRKFSDWSKKMIEEFGEKIKEHLKDIWKTIDKKFPRIRLEKELTDTKVRDEKGNILTVYSGHANTPLYKEYNPKKSTAGGYYASENPEIASNYSMGKFGGKEYYENGEQYRIKGKNGEYNKKLWQIELTEAQKKKLDELSGLKNEYDEYVYRLDEMMDWAKDNKNYEPLARRILARGKYDLQNIYDYNEHMGYNIAYPKQPTEKSEPLFERQVKNDTEEIMDALGIDWQAYDWNQPGVFPVYLNIRNPLDADKPFPQDLLTALKDASKYEREKSDQFGMLSSQWTNEYPLKQWVKDIESGEEGWSTQIPKKALPILKQFGYDGIKERGSKGIDKPREERGINWIAFDKEQIIPKYSRFAKTEAEYEQAKNRLISEESFAQAKQNILTKGQNLTSGIDPTLLKDYAIIGSYHLETIARKGIQKGKEYAEWTKEMLKELGEDIKPYLKQIWDEINKGKTTEEISEAVKETKKTGGEIKVRGLAKSTEADAIASGIVDKINNLPTYEVRPNDPQIKIAADIIANDLDRAKRIEFGIEKPPDNMLPGFIHTGLKDYAVEHNDVELMMKLATSPYLSEQGTIAGQFIQALGKHEPFDPVDAIKEVTKGDTPANKRIKIIRDGLEQQIKLLENKIKQRDEEIKKISAERTIKKIKREVDYQARREKRTYTREQLKEQRSKLYADLYKETANLNVAVPLSTKAIKILGEITKNYVTEGLVDATAIIDAIHNEVKDKIEGITKQDIRNAISGYGRSTERTKTELQKTVQDLKKQMEIISKLEDLKAGKLPLKRPKTRMSPSEQLKSLETELNKELKDLRDKERLENEPLRRTEAKIKQLEKQIEETKSKLEGTFSPTTKREPVQLNEEGKKLQNELVKLKTELKQQRQESGIADQENLSKSKAMLRKRIAEYEEKISKGEYSEIERTVAPIDKEKTKLQEKLKETREKYKDIQQVNLKKTITFEEATKINELSKIAIKAQKKMENSTRSESLGDATEAELEYGRAKVAFVRYIDNLKAGANKLTWKEFKASPLGNIAKGLGHLPGMTKSLKATFDNSGLFNQNITVLFTHPYIWQKNALKSFQDIWKVMGNKNAMDEIDAWLVSRPKYEDMLIDKLAIGTIEEAFPDSKLIEKTPYLGRVHKAANTAFTGLAYRNRADIYDLVTEHAKNLGHEKTTGLGIGSLVNSLTGRGSLGRFERGADVFNTLMFAPRFLKSHIDVLVTPFRVGSEKYSPFARKEAAKNLMKIVGGIAAITVVANTIKPGTVETDPRSTDFMKIKVGDTRFNFTGGLGAIATLASRIIPLLLRMEAYTKNAKGELEPLNLHSFGSRTGWDVLVDFMRGKSSPASSFVIQRLMGQTFGGDRLTLGRELSNIAVPLPLTNYNELMNNPKSADIIIASIADAVGIFTNTYSNDPDIQKIKRSLLEADEKKFGAKKEDNFYTAVNNALTNGLITKEQAEDYEKQFRELQAIAPEKIEEEEDEEDNIPISPRNTGRGTNRPR